jgi:copper homeostasis protein (lipoprotein)
MRSRVGTVCYWLSVSIASLLLIAPIAIGQDKNPKLGDLPASFRGDLPCADCPGIRYTLNLLLDASFFARMIYLDRKMKPVDDLGRWVLSPDGTKLTLRNSKGSSESSTEA